MIINGILSIVQGILNVLLAPLTLINIGVDFFGSIPVVTQFLQLGAYLLPWGNLMPLISIVISIFIFRATLSFVKLIWQFIPIIGN